MKQKIGVIGCKLAFHMARLQFFWFFVRVSDRWNFTVVSTGVREWNCFDVQNEIGIH